MVVQLRPNHLSSGDETGASEEVAAHTVWHGVMGTGQSLSVGFSGALSESTRPVAHALRLHDESKTYDIERPEATSLRAVALTEPFRDHEDGAGPYPVNIDGLTPHSSMAKAIAHMNEQHKSNSSPFITVHSAVGIGGALMSVIEKQKDPQHTKDGQNAYAASIFEAQALTRLARAQDAVMQYDAILLTHGESDALMNNDHYAEDVMRLQTDFAKDVREITGQNHDPILILSQQNTCPPARQFLPLTTSAMWEVQSKSHSRVVCAGPKYQFEYSPDGLHLDWKGYERLGEKYGQVFFQTVVQGKSFTPLFPTSAKLASDRRSVVAHFSVPVGPLRWDTSLPTPHRHTRHAYWSRGRGFELRDSQSRPLGIQGAHIDDFGTSVTITLADDVEVGGLSQPLNLAYAMTQEGEGFGVGFCGGTEKGRMGWLSDSDAGCGLTRRLTDCHVQKGSRKVHRSRGWSECSRTDIVAPGDISIVRISGDDAFLEHEWAGQSGVVDLDVGHNQRNYCVAFSINVSDSH